MLALGAAVLAAGTVFAASLARFIVLPLRQAVVVAQRVAGGELTSTMTASTRAEGAGPDAERDDSNV